MIPQSLRRSILNSVHSAHLGINHCASCARELYFLQGMTSQIRNYVSSCELC
ncbi:hypothetical protein H7673_11275 [Streptococcus dysgalactiae subsp. equisimilis]|nr:hypothetical protein [Streptococcus dysgalactiae subsp. equisimilis]